MCIAGLAAESDVGCGCCRGRKNFVFNFVASLAASMACDGLPAGLVSPLRSAHCAGFSVCVSWILVARLGFRGCVDWWPLCRLWLLPGVVQGSQGLFSCALLVCARAETWISLGVRYFVLLVSICARCCLHVSVVHGRSGEQPSSPIVEN